MKQFKILWTGGWDSTFRVVELSRKEVQIHPVYVIDNNRQSKKYELDSMRKIIDTLKSKSETKASFDEIEFINKDDIPMNKEITEAYNIIKQKTGLGSQHEWLARLPEEYNGIEMGTEAGEPETSHIIHALQEFCDVTFDEDGIGHLNSEKSSKEGMLVLGKFSFPILNKTEEDMLKIIHEWKYEDVMEHIWFCHTPINNKPCGFCHPCQVKIESNMSFLLPQKAVNRYKTYKACEKMLGSRITNKGFRKIFKI